MLFHDISMVRILGLRGTLYVQIAEDAEGVSVQTEGPYEAKVIDDTCLMICPEDQAALESQLPHRSHTGMAIGQTNVGSVDVTARSQFLTDPLPRTKARPRTRTPRPRTRARTSLRLQATVRVTAPRGTQFELVGCQGVRKGPRGSHVMLGNDRFVTRTRR